MFKLHTLAIVTALCATTACKSDKSQREANRAAEAVNDRAQDVRKEAKDVRETATDDRNDLADKIQDNREDLKKDLKDVAENISDRADKTADKAKDNANDVNDEMKDVSKEVRSLDEAQNEFAYQRAVRIETLRAVHAIDATQPVFINAVYVSGGFDTESTNAIFEKMNIFKSRLDDAGGMIQALGTVEANAWVDREKLVANAMNRLEDAREAAWDAVADAKRMGGPTAMR